MTEHREPPRIVSGERRIDDVVEASVADRPVFRRFDFVRSPRQLHRGRLGFLLAAAVGLFVGLASIGYIAIWAAIDWLHHQPQYQLPVDQIDLVPEPPAWFRGGKPAFLDGMRRAARLEGNIPILDVGPAQLGDEFKKYSWVLDVEKVDFRRVPGPITIQLRYREPVAFVQLADREQFLVDATGAILRPEDVDADRLKHLCAITGKGLAAPSDPTPGHIWKVHPEGLDHDEPDKRVLAAARLAGFLIAPSRRGEGKPLAATRIIRISVTDFESRGLFVWTGEGVAIRWGDAPGDEPPGSISAEEKWRKLVRWRNTILSPELLPRGNGDYLEFSDTDVSVVCFHPQEPHRTRIP